MTGTDPAALVFHGFDGVHHLGHQHFQGVGGVVQLFRLKTQVAAGLGPSTTKASGW